MSQFSYHALILPHCTFPASQSPLCKGLAGSVPAIPDNSIRFVLELSTPTAVVITFKEDVHIDVQ